MTVRPTQASVANKALRWYRVICPYACGAVLAGAGGVVVDTCPIYHWMIGGNIKLLPKAYRAEEMK